MSYSRLLGAVAWNPPATPDYPLAAGTGAPADDSVKLARLLMIRELGQTGGGADDMGAQLKAGTLTPDAAAAWVRAWRDNNPNGDQRTMRPSLVSWAAAQLNGNALASSSGGTLGGMALPFGLTPAQLVLGGVGLYGLFKMFGRRRNGYAS